MSSCWGYHLSGGISLKSNYQEETLKNNYLKNNYLSPEKQHLGFHCVDLECPPANLRREGLIKFPAEPPRRANRNCTSHPRRSSARSPPRSPHTPGAIPKTFLGVFRGTVRETSWACLFVGGLPTKDVGFLLGVPLKPQKKAPSTENADVTMGHGSMFTACPKLGKRRSTLRIWLLCLKGRPKMGGVSLFGGNTLLRSGPTGKLQTNQLKRRV